MERRGVYELARMGVLTAVLFMGQVVLAFLPNVEIVGLLVILYMLFFGKKYLAFFLLSFFWKDFFTASGCGGFPIFTSGICWRLWCCFCRGATLPSSGA